MADILAAAGSNSSTSINFQLVRYTASLVEGHQVELLDMSQKSYPMYSADLEKASGIPGGILAFLDRLRAADGWILSVNEHNGNPSAFTKNFLDWLSREDRKFMDGIPVLLMSASGGKRGGRSSREVTSGMLTRFGADITSEFSLPSYYDTFDPSQGIVDAELRSEHLEALQVFLNKF